MKKKPTMIRPDCDTKHPNDKSTSLGTRPLKRPWAVLKKGKEEKKRDKTNLNNESTSPGPKSTVCIDNQPIDKGV